LLTEKENDCSGRYGVTQPLNLRDEIKSNYASVPNALEKQRMIYK
jgi:hypothetical protein